MAEGSPSRADRERAFRWRRAVDWLIPSSVHARGREAVRQAHATILVSALSAAAGLAVNLGLGVPLIGPMRWLVLAQVALLLALPLVLRLTGKLELIRTALPFLVLLLILSASLPTLGRATAPLFLWAVPSIALVLSGRRAAVGWGILACGALVLMVALAESSLPSPQPFTREEGARATRNVGLLMTVVFFGAVLILDAVRSAALRDREFSAAELRASRTWYHRLIDASPDALLVVQNRRLVFANARAATLFEAPSVEAMLGRPLADLTPEGEVESNRAAFYARLTHPDETTPAYRTMARSLDNRTFPVEVRGARTEFGGAPASLFLIRSTASEDASLAQLRLLLAAFEQSDDAIVAADSSGVVRYANPSFLRNFAKGMGEIVGRRWLDALAEPDAEVTRKIMKRIVTEGVGSGRLTVSEEDATTSEWIYQVSSIELPNEPQVSYLTIVRNVTREIELERRMREAEKLEAVGRLAGGVAHDLNNQLTVVLGRVDSLRERIGGSAPASAQDLDAIAQAAQRSAGIARQLLSVARRAPVDPRRLDVNQLVRELAGRLRSAEPRPLELSLQLAEDLPAVVADRDQLGQALASLALGARDARPGARVVLRTGLASLPAELGGAGAAGERFVALWIWSGGESPDPGARSQVFDPFAALGADGERSGLDLPGAQGVVAQAHGHIGVQPNPAGGDVLTIYLPLAAPAPAAEGSAPVSRRSPRILVVDDDLAVRALACRALERAGYETREAESGEDALALFAKEPDAAELVVTDLAMPGISGIGLAEHLAARSPRLPVLFVTGYSSAAAEYYVPSPTRALLAKPYTADVLVARVRELLESGRAGVS